MVVRNGTPSDIAFVDKMQKENSNAVGFIQRTIWDKYVFGGERNFFVLVCEKNGDMVGYTLVTSGKSFYDYVKIQQIAVREDARRLEYGSALVEVIRIFCKQYGRLGARLKCRIDLEANLFWSALGFTKVGVWQKGKRNHVGFEASDDINIWQIDLNDVLIELFPIQAIEVQS